MKTPTNTNTHTHKLTNKESRGKSSEVELVKERSKRTYIRFLQLEFCLTHTTKSCPKEEMLLMLQEFCFVGFFNSLGSQFSWICVVARSEAKFPNPSQPKLSCKSTSCHNSSSLSSSWRCCWSAFMSSLGVLLSRTELVRGYFCHGQSLLGVLLSQTELIRGYICHGQSSLRGISVHGQSWLGGKILSPTKLGSFTTE